MSHIIKSPTPTVCQVSGALPSGEPMLAVLARRTYEVDDAGRCVVADEQAPLVGEPVTDPERPNLLLADSDLCPYKPRTDLVVHGHAYGRQRARRLEAVIRVGAEARRIAVVGARTCSLGPAGRVTLSEPAPIDRVELSWRMAYGGRDRGAEAVHGNPLLADPELARSMKQVDLDAASPFIYPRNPIGRGYLVEATPAAVEQLELPQLEDPEDPLTPERLVAGEVFQWHRMPLPWLPGWVDYSWYPRVAFLGVVPIVECFDEPPLEVERGLVPDYLADGTGRMIHERAAFDIANGAAPGFQLELLRGGEPVALDGLHPGRSRWSFTVPPPPRMCTDGREGRLNQAQAVLHNLVVEPDSNRVTVLWRGAAQALRRYAPRELEGMPLRVEWRD